MFEEIIESLARAAEELPEDATPLEIRDRPTDQGVAKLASAAARMDEGPG